MKKSPQAKKKLPPATNARPVERRHTGVAGDPQSMAIAGALNDAQANKPRTVSEDDRATQKRIREHPAYVLLRRVARDNYTPKRDELDSLNLSPKQRSELAFAIRQVARYRDQPPEVEERYNAKGTKVINAGYTSPAYIAQNKADELGTAFVSSLPADHETRLEIKTRHAAEDAQAQARSEDPQAIADRVRRLSHE